MPGAGGPKGTPTITTNLKKPAPVSGFVVHFICAPAAGACEIGDRPANARGSKQTNTIDQRQEACTIRLCAALYLRAWRKQDRRSACECRGPQVKEHYKTKEQKEHTSRRKEHIRLRQYIQRFGYATWRKFVGAPKRPAAAMLFRREHSGSRRVRRVVENMQMHAWRGGEV